jgi:murein DD-endopeptidase MepM/ murein hydrolase activator NlpD
MNVWRQFAQSGVARKILRLGTHALLLLIILGLALGLRQLYFPSQPKQNTGGIFAAGTTTPSPGQAAALLPDIAELFPKYDGIPRLARLHTDVPSRPRQNVEQYLGKPGDTLFGIAEKFGLKPETILWSNQLVLGDNPHSLRPGQELNILPVDGAYYQWSAGDGLNGVAEFYGVKPEDIISYSANHLDPTTIGDWSHPNIDAGKWLVIPGGRREFVSWSAPAIPLDHPEVAKVLGPGACENVQGGLVGSGAFIWPSANHYLSGYDYEPNANHPGIDIAGKEGDSVYAADNGVVVYAGWNNWGYGNVIVINHGNGWQTLYAHLSAYTVSCGQFVYQGNVIGAIGTTGNSDGPHLHFEMMYNAVRVNPHDYLPK